MSLCLVNWNQLLRGQRQIGQIKNQSKSFLIYDIYNNASLWTNIKYFLLYVSEKRKECEVTIY